MMMLMTPSKLILFRLYNVTVGRFAPFSALLRWALVKRLIRPGKAPYVQSARYFDWDDFGPDLDEGMSEAHDGTEPRGSWRSR